MFVFTSKKSFPTVDANRVICFRGAAETPRFSETYGTSLQKIQYSTDSLLGDSLIQYSSPGCIKQ